MNQAVDAKADWWGEMIDAQRASGRTVAAYCRSRGITPSTFYAWKRRLRRATPARAFVQVQTTAEDTPPLVEGSTGQASGIDVCLRGGRRLRVARGFDPDVLTELVGVLEGLP